MNKEKRNKTSLLNKPVQKEPLLKRILTAKSKWDDKVRSSYQCWLLAWDWERILEKPLTLALDTYLTIWCYSPK